MSTFLELCKDFHRYARMDAAHPGTRPTTVVGQTDTGAEIVGFVNDAYKAIQNEQTEWKFKVARGSFETVAGTREYNVAEQLGLSLYDGVLPFRARDVHSTYVLGHLTDTGISDQQPIYFIPYEQFRGWDDLGERTEQRPHRFTVRPDGVWEFDGTPDAEYTITFDYRIGLHSLTADADEPMIPGRHQQVIVWRAIQHYCDSRDGTGELLAKAERNLKRMMFALKLDQLPLPTMAVMDMP